MNHCQLIGRISKDPELKYTPANKAVLTFSLAVDRRKKEDGTKETDWIDCVAWEKTAELIAKYVRKGHKLGVVGHLQKRTWETKEGQKRSITEVLVKEIELIEKTEQAPAKAEQKPIPEPGYYDPDEDDAPF